MTKIFKNMAPYWYMIVAIVLLLIVQAFGDLSLPQYTSDIIDVGIQNKGVEHILPVKMMEDEYEIYQVENGKKAIGILEKSREEFKLVLLDMNMPVMDGYEALSIMRKRVSITFAK